MVFRSQGSNTVLQEWPPKNIPGPHSVTRNSHSNSHPKDTFLSSTHGLLSCLISSWGQEWFRIGLFFKHCLFTKGPHLACLETTTLPQETRDLARLIFWVISCACSWSPAFWQGLPCLSYAHRTPKDFLLFVILGGIHQDPRPGLDEYLPRWQKGERIWGSC